MSTDYNSAVRSGVSIPISAVSTTVATAFLDLTISNPSGGRVVIDSFAYNDLTGGSGALTVSVNDGTNNLLVDAAGGAVNHFGRGPIASSATSIRIRATRTSLTAGTLTATYRMGPA